ncbi:MAG TPA: hypothetical protein VGN97_19150 [Mesorhizobium sp.]|jgi:predicted transcriptional regulator|nr:hypothetical protein [Mesorhizobium sp.]
MTELLKEAFEAARRLPPDAQDEVARLLLEIVHDADAEPYVLTDEERKAVEESMAEADRGEFATDEEIEAIFAKHSR